MKKSIEYRGVDVFYTLRGKGPALVFIHGYLESKAVWESFIPRFTGDHTVICIDIPGHGESGVIGQVHEMEDMARAVKAVIDAEKREKITLFGHSMGGYITLSFVSLFPGTLNGYCLFHSTCFADNEEKKKNREREISLVKCGKKMQIIHTNIPKGFADSNLGKMDDMVSTMKEIAVMNPESGIVALLRGMMNRKDHTATLKRSVPHPLIIWGKKDNYIPEEVFQRLTEISPASSVIILKNSGHMGFLEEPDCAYSGIKSYLSGVE